MADPVKPDPCPAPTPDPTPEPCNMQNCCNPPQHVPSLLGGAENMKLLFDDQLALSRRVHNIGAAIDEQALLDNQSDSRAWAALKLRQAQNAATLDHLAALNNLAQAQTGTTEDQQTVSPEDTATSEALKGAVGTAAVGEAVSAEAITANVANLMTALTPVIAAAIATATAQTLAAILPIVISASGTGSGNAQPPSGTIKP